MGKRYNAFLRAWSDWQRDVYSGIGFEIRKSFVMGCCVACTAFFADEYFMPAVACE